MKNLIIPVILSIVATIGCSKSAPKCSDVETKDLVKQIALREMNNQVGAETAKLFSYALDIIRTTSTNKQTGAHECAAQLNITERNTGEVIEIPITYKVELTDSGEEFYVSVFGL